jgi:XTP/dITP diphosphohydrolase
LEKQLLLATSNQGKLRELRTLLDGLDVALTTPRELGVQLEVSETGDTYRANASLKALAYTRATGLIVLADDSGLEVAALNGAPGIHSARFSPKPSATDKDRRDYLLERLANSPRPWHARFVCLAAVATPQENLLFAEGICPGEIIPEERGTQGFGYDPIFFLPELQRTMAELDMHTKNKLSHRGRAVAAMRPILQELFTSLNGK